MPTFKQFAEGFFTPDDPQGVRMRDKMRNKQSGEMDYQNKQRFLDRYLIPEFGDYLLDSITPVIIEDYILEMVSFKDHRTPLSDDTKNKALVCMRKVFHEAERKRIVRDNPAEKVGMINARSKERKPFSPTVFVNVVFAIFYKQFQQTAFSAGR
ncbi:phage integrase SAM-like domain-containing protein [Sphaerochaeta pleomorpha]|nr:phage integrase SAM-like domain-containing protein [Sphaerochaeta pleomorpha]